MEPDLPGGWVEGFARMVRALGSNEYPSDLRRLTGGLETETFAFRIGADRLVVKVFTKGGDQAAIEFENLAVASDAVVATPEPVLSDVTGAWFKTPAIVMTALHGHPDMHPSDRRQWIRDAGEALVSIHEIPVGRAIHVRTARWRRWWPTTGGMGIDSPQAEICLSRLREEAGQLPTVISHDDYNPGNLLFDNGRLSGIVDWADIAIEPRQAAVALFRHFLAIHPGGDAPDLFLDAYERASETFLEGLPLWDILYGLRGVRPTLDHWVLAFDGLGLTISSEEIQNRSYAWVRKAMSLTEH